jgi:hypothetical protein
VYQNIKEMEEMTTPVVHFAQDAVTQIVDCDKIIVVDIANKQPPDTHDLDSHYRRQTGSRNWV